MISLDNNTSYRNTDIALHVVLKYWLTNRFEIFSNSISKINLVVTAHNKFKSYKLLNNQTVCYIYF